MAKLSKNSKQLQQNLLVIYNLIKKIFGTKLFRKFSSFLYAHIENHTKLLNEVQQNIRN